MQSFLALAGVMISLADAQLFSAKNPPPLVEVPPQYPTVLKPNDTGEPDIMCYRCNMYRGGGTYCPEQMGKDFYDPANYTYTIMNHCAVCIKVTTVVNYRDRFYGPDQPKQFSSTSTVVSRACALAVREARLKEGCINQYTHSGYIRRCYCTTNLCNGATGPMVAAAASIRVLTVAAAALACFASRRWQLLPLP